MEDGDVVFCYEDDVFESDFNDIWQKAQEVLPSINGNWDFAQYEATMIGDRKIEYVCYVDKKNSDRTFTLEWDNKDVPWEEAVITVDTD
jgi:hypothetical protein